MNMHRSTLPSLFLLSTLFVSCAAAADPFSDYWHQGKAEITSYTLEQARYGEVHPGTAVMIFVTEDFSAKKQVKLDQPAAAGTDRVPILKLNATRSFNTGIYPYSMMTSVFSPIEANRTALKVTTTSQEWCGHSFTQLNQRRDGYRLRQYSYFEAEGDIELDLKDALLEDNLWTTIRLSPDSLPTGKLNLVPGTVYLRLSHIEIAAYRATARLTPSADGLMTYSLTYPDLGRTLDISFREEFPHEIEGWRETGRSRGKELVTEAKRLRRILTPYWNQNSLADADRRAELGFD